MHQLFISRVMGKQTAYALDLAGRAARVIKTQHTCRFMRAYTVKASVQTNAAPRLAQPQSPLYKMLKVML